jgi:hypothetical protein
MDTVHNPIDSDYGHFYLVLINGSRVQKISAPFSYIPYSPTKNPYLWSSESSWLQIQRSWFDSRRYQIFWEVVGLERGPLSLVSTTEELLEIKSISSGRDSREYGRRGPSRWQRGTPLSSKIGTHFSDKLRSLGGYNSLGMQHTTHNGCTPAVG